MNSKLKLSFYFVTALFCFLVANINEAFAQIKIDENGNENFVNNVARDTSLNIIFIFEREATTALEPIAIDLKSKINCCLCNPAINSVPVQTQYIIDRQFLLNKATNDLIVPIPKL